jgi:hypothetical protein
VAGELEIVCLTGFDLDVVRQTIDIPVFIGEKPGPRF